jgi:hypothetical protein
MTKKRVIISVDAGLHKKVKLLAVQKDVTMADLIEQALINYINLEGTKS